MPPTLPRFTRRSLLLAALVAAFFLGSSFAAFAYRVSSLRALRATGPNWSFPSRVFSDGVALVAGRAASMEYLHSELTARGYRAVRGSPAAPGTYAQLRGGLEIVLRGFQDVMDPEGSGGPEHVVVWISSGRITAVSRRGG